MKRIKQLLSTPIPKKWGIIGSSALAIACLGLLIYFATSVFRFQDYTPKPDLTLSEVQLKGLDHESVLMIHVGDLFSVLDIPREEGKIFEGWYLDESGGERITGTSAYASGTEEIYARWSSSYSEFEMPILSFESFTDSASDDPSKYPIAEFEKLITQLKSENYYFPTWRELDAWLDGVYNLPQKSIVITANQNDRDTRLLADPTISNAKALMTIFADTNPDIAELGKNSKFVLVRSQGNTLYEFGPDNEPAYQIWSEARIKEDIETSATILGVREVFAYPRGEYDSIFKAAASTENFWMAVTQTPGFISKSSDKFELPRFPITPTQSAAWIFENIINR